MGRAARQNRDPGGSTARAGDVAGKPAGAPQPPAPGASGTDTSTAQVRLDIATGPQNPASMPGYAPPPSDATDAAKRDGDTRTKPLQRVLADSAIAGDVPAHVVVNIPVGSEPTHLDSTTGTAIIDPDKLGAGMGQEEPDDERSKTAAGGEPGGDDGDDTARRMAEQQTGEQQQEQQQP